MGKMSEIEYDSRQMSSLASELRSYPQHYVAAHRAADRIEKLEDALLSVIARLGDEDSWLAQSIDARNTAEAALEGGEAQMRSDNEAERHARDLEETIKDIIYGKSDAPALSFDDLVTRLRDFPVRDCCSQRAEAADRIEQLEAELRKAKEDLDLLDALMKAGVDNWSGYDYALDIFEGRNG